MKENFNVQIIESSRELTKREKLLMSNVSNAVSIDSVVTEECPLVIEPKDYVRLQVHNEKLDDGKKDYEIIIVIDSSGNKYYTGSANAIDDFIDVYCDMVGEDESYGVEFYKKLSKNYNGKYFIGCTII